MPPGSERNVGLLSDHGASGNYSRTRNLAGLWEVDHLRNLWPTIARSQLLAGHEADMNRPRCEVALIDRPLGPVGSFIDFTAKQEG
jgi:hypothetical protein